MPYATSGPAAVLATGTVTTFSGFPLVVGIEKPHPLEVEFRFTSDPAVPDVAILPISQEHSRIVWNLVNFDSADGRGSAEPALLLEAETYRIYLHFRVFRYGRTRDRTVHYTFFEVGIGAAGW